MRFQKNTHVPEQDQGYLSVTAGVVAIPPWHSDYDKIEILEKMKARAVFLCGFKKRFE